MADNEISLRVQADAVKIVGQNAAGHLENLRSNPKQPAWKGDVIEDRLPALRAAYRTLNDLAKEAEGHE